MADQNVSYTIGTVARITGLSTHVLRKWEARYGLIEPVRSTTGRRRYSPDDLTKLRSLATLVHRGHAISELASLSAHDLMVMVEMNPVVESAKHVRVSVSGAGLAAMIAAERTVFPSSYDFLVVSGHPEMSGETDVLVIECASLSDELHNRLMRLSQVVVVYNFSSSRILQQFEDSGMTCLKAPITAARLLPYLPSKATSDLPIRPNAALPPPPLPRFSDASIAAIANASTTIECECPLHIAQLLTSISAFERYSAECETQQPDDRELHGFLRQIAGRARAQFEVALARVAVAEGYVLNELDGSTEPGGSV
ncbi:MAG: hypothetical protein CMP98_14235 [Gammaproteobacteria bacterium]|nr:hypothetical protein [Gammaproteobacteria bacterium]OUU06634.1 MAG: hypothetical protein CBB94_15025 [Gammaproteobacteria bacterium TMED34]